MMLMLIKYYYFKKSNNEYIIRYNDVNKMTVVPFLVPSLVQLINTHKYTHQSYQQEYNKNI